MTPGFDLEEAPGGTYFTETKQADPFVTAAYKALGDQFVEVLSERSGGFLTDMLGAGARKVGLCGDQLFFHLCFLLVVEVNLHTLNNDHQKQ
jgi:hypothetical protein